MNRFFDIAKKLTDTGDRKRAHQVAVRIRDPHLAEAAEFQGNGEAPKDACELAREDAKAGRYEDAHRKLAGNKCDCSVVASIYAEAGRAADTVRAPAACDGRYRALEITGRIAARFVERGDIPGAFQILDTARVVTALDEGYFAPGLREVSKALAAQDLGATVRWARSFSYGYQTSRVLLGISDSMPWIKQEPDANRR